MSSDAYVQKQALLLGKKRYQGIFHLTLSFRALSSSAYFSFLSLGGFSVSCQYALTVRVNVDDGTSVHG